ncbi:hypothetical protein NC652_037931 [Populus alba x Populus x berolinensis]|nr:hypothetical protein NC652_037931 [Populus alba x Populus x berolinensis]
MEGPHPPPSMGMQLKNQRQIECPLPDIDFVFFLQISICPKQFPFCLSSGNSRVIEFCNRKTSGLSIFVHTVIFFGLITIFLIAAGVHIYTG